ncbi:hypothetical protein NK356_01465 [Chryseobacterium sp. S0630]|uniref:bacteriocin-like protein n=1 Tax=Chryseobacterium sp. S0630 TaxID=2957803 RepID=UPI00209F049C|nr:hypothetical protein [Chryseobacterium sp. S0630]MCP1297839.1 hypothetical protein [Chryseobacterium sp. S0630]
MKNLKKLSRNELKTVEGGLQSKTWFAETSCGITAITTQDWTPQQATEWRERVEVINILTAKFDTRTDNKYKDQFLLQIGDNRAFFANAVSLKGDSVMTNSGTSTYNPDGSDHKNYR